MLSLGVFVALSETEVNDVDVVFSAIIAANQEVVWLDISMNDPLFVDLLNTGDLQIRESNTHERMSITQIRSKRKAASHPPIESEV